MSDITYTDKEDGDSFTAADANEIKAAVNSKADKDNTAFILGQSSDLKILTAAQPVDGENLITATPSDKDLQGYNATAVDSLVGAGFAFDTFPEYEDSSHAGSGIAVNANTLAVWSATAGKWLTVALTDTLAATPDVPVFVSASIDATGTSITMIFDQDMAVGANLGTWTIDCSTTGLLALSTSVAGTESDVTFDIVSGPVLAGETVELYYTIPAGNDGLESVDDGTPLVGWAVAESVTNGSEVTGSTAEGFEGTGAPAGWSTVTGSPNYDDATAPAPATGAQSLSLLAGAAVRTPDTGDASTRYFAFSFINDSADNTSNADILALRNAATTIIGTIYRSATDIFYLNAGTKYSSATALPLTAGTKYFVWMEWVTDPGGSTGVFRVRV